jgi:hypothetical protein
MFTILTIGIAVVIAIISVIKIRSISYSLKAVIRNRNELQLALESKIIQLETELTNLYEANSTQAAKTSSELLTPNTEKQAKPKRKYYNKPKNPKS